MSYKNTLLARKLALEVKIQERITLLGEQSQRNVSVSFVPNHKSDMLLRYEKSLENSIIKKIGMLHQLKLFQFGKNGKESHYE